jgi:chromate transporter
VTAAAAGAGAAIAAVAVQAGAGLLPASWRAARSGDRARQARWAVYLAAGINSAAVLGPWLVLVLLGCGAAEIAARIPQAPARALAALPVSLAAGAAGAAGAGGVASLIWVALKVGALSYGGGFVIIPLMQADAVTQDHWMTGGQFLSAVALGQVTPGPVVQTVAFVGYAAHGVAGGLLASVIAFSPSFAFILLGARHFDRLRGNRTARAFLDGTGSAAIAGSAIPLARALTEPWQYAVLGGAALLLLALRCGVVVTLLLAGTTGVALAAAGAALRH